MGRLLKILIIVVAVGLILLLIRRTLARRHRRPPPTRIAAHDMVPCAHCGVHLAKTEAVVDGGTVFCSEEHRQAGARR